MRCCWSAILPRGRRSGMHRAARCYNRADGIFRYRAMWLSTTRSACASPWHRRNTSFHAGGNLWHGKSDGAQRARRARRANCPRQYLPLVAAARPRSHRSARRAAPVYGLAAPDPHRLRRISSIQPGPVTQSKRGRRDLRLSSQRRQVILDA